jgi:polysaccharide export outer membrane protein
MAPAVRSGGNKVKKLLYGWLFAWTAIWFASASYASVDEYRLGTGDVLRIAVYSQPDLTTETRLDERGEIIFPLLGAVKLGGMTPGAAGREISKRLRSGGFLVDPHVNLNVVQYRSQQVSVLGRVNRPGQFALEKPGRVSDVLALAGGVMPDAAEVITLIRANDGKAQFTEIDMLALFKPGGEKLNVVVADGDIINVQRQPVFISTAKYSVRARSGWSAT